MYCYVNCYSTQTIALQKNCNTEYIIILSKGPVHAVHTSIRCSYFCRAVILLYIQFSRANYVQHNALNIALYRINLSFLRYFQLFNFITKFLIFSSQLLM